jgi:hypothetical protein
VTIEVIAGNVVVSFRGFVVRVIVYPSRQFPGCVAGVGFENADINAVNRILGIADAIGTLESYGAE